MIKRCPITYQQIEALQRYSVEGLKLLSPLLTTLQPLTLSAKALRQEALKRADKMSIQGVQSKLSVRLNVSKSCFEIVDHSGTFILKPQHELYKHAPENEDLTMKCAAAAGIAVPVHGLIYSEDGELTYFIKRFDRYSKNKKYAVEDFAQLAEKKRETKYAFSMEKLIPIIDRYASFPVLEKASLLRRTLVNFLLGNEDMHLKNFSLLNKNSKITLAPAYDFINSTLALPNAKEEIALPLNGRKNNLRRKDFIDYYAGEKLNLNIKVINLQLDAIQQAVPVWKNLIAISFLPDELKQDYLALLEVRLKILSI